LRLGEVKGCAAARREAKKRHVQSGDAPSNKTYGNCLLGLHCSQKPPAASRVFPGFAPVAGCQQQFSSTAYQQCLVHTLGTVSDPPQHAKAHTKPWARRPHCICSSRQSTIALQCLL